MRPDEERHEPHDEEHAPLTPRQRASLRFLQMNTPVSLLCCITTALVSAMVVPSIHYVFRSQPTYFTMAPRMLLAFGIAMLLFEFGFCLLSIITPNIHTQRCIVQGAGSRLALSNYLLSMWLLCRVVDSRLTMVIGSFVLGTVVLLTATNGVVLRAKYRPRWVHPFELLLVHVPNKLVLLLAGQVLLWDQLMLTWGWDRSLGRHALEQGLWFAIIVQTLVGILLIAWLIYTSDLSVYVISMFLDAAVLKFQKMPVIGPNSRPLALTLILFISMTLRTVALVVPLMLDNGFLIICHSHRRHVPDQPYENAAVQARSPQPQSAQQAVPSNAEDATERTSLLASAQQERAYDTVS